MCGSNFQAYVRRPSWMDGSDATQAYQGSLSQQAPDTDMQLRYNELQQRTQAEAEMEAETRALFGFLFGGRGQDDDR